MRPFRPTAGLALLAAACGPDPHADIQGTFGGASFSPQTYYWGGPYIVFTTREVDCIDLFWVKRGNKFQTGQEPPTDADQRVLLFTYEGDQVAAGDYDLGGDAPVDARVLDISGATLTVTIAVEGNLVVDEVEEEGRATGSFSLDFGDEGALSGDFDVEWCNNLLARD